MVQNCKVVHWPVKALDTAELKQGCELPARYCLPTAQTRRSQNCERDGFEPFHVRFEPYPDLVVQSRDKQNGSFLYGWTNGQELCQKLRHYHAYASKAEQYYIQR